MLINKMKTLRYKILLMIGVLLSSSCSDDKSADKEGSQASKYAKPELIIGKLDRPNHMLSVTISNPSETPISIAGSAADIKDNIIYGAYWFVGNKLVGAPECGTGFWESSFTIEPGAKKNFSVWLPLRKMKLPEKMTLSIVYTGHGATPQDAQQSISDDDSQDNWVRHPDLILNCRKVEAEVTITGKTKAEQNAAKQPGSVPQSKTRSQ